MSEAPQCGIDQMRGGARVGEVGSDGQHAAWTFGFQRFLQGKHGLGGVLEVQDHIESRRMQRSRDDRTNPPRGAGDQCDGLWCG